MFPRPRVTLSDGFSVGFLVTVLFSIYTYEVFLVLPTIEESYVKRLIHIVLGSYVFLNIVVNLAMVMLTDTSTKRIILPSLLKPMWHFCAVCEANSPPRTHHCNKCNCCILKRDHHCTFSGCCIGLKNFRFFIMFLLYLSIGCLYATSLNMFFIWDILGGFSLFSAVAHIVPFVFWVFGYLSFKVFIYTLLSCIAMVGFLFVTNLLWFHARQMVHNQTTFEKNNGILTYDLGWKKNLIQSLGERWHLTLIWPLFDSPLPSDGLSYDTQKNQSPIPQPITLHEGMRLRRT